MLALRSLVHEALLEDIGQGDITTNLTVPEDARCRAHLLAKQDGVLSGMGVFRAVFEGVDADMTNWKTLSDGTKFSKGTEIASFEATTRAVLTGERVALNFVQRLCGIATLTSKYVDTLAGLSTRICDTRKTTPFLRHLEKKAVQHGGGFNHRFALFDGVLIKENHIIAAGGVRNAVEKAANGTHHLMKVGVEVTTLDELRDAIAAGAGAILLDNMDLEQIRASVEIAKGTHVVLEASGNMSLERVRAIAETGVHIISIGALTHSAPAIDLSLEIENV
ncbi:MAG: carboxylating nicotinate-nucleotide diphosphorylase [Candidatus Hydrogenedentales bacterium]|jgi:nicotinate-nucleotide pyrophosphorylase (carboxylating)